MPLTQPGHIQGWSTSQIFHPAGVKETRTVRTHTVWQLILKA